MRPLTDVLVLDFGRFVAAPSAAQQLRSLGADVIKIEPLPAGDPARRQPRPTAGPHPSGSAFIAYNSGKRSIALDLRSPLVRPVLERLVERADVLIEGFRPGVMSRMGFPPDKARADNSQLVYASLRGFNGDSEQRRAVDGIIQAESGIMAVNGDGNGPPTKVGFPVTDICCGLALTQAVLVALLNRSKTGIGDVIEISLLDAALYIQSGMLLECLTTGIEPKRLGNTAALAAPSDAYQAADGFVVLSAYLERDWTAFVELIEREDLLSDPRFSSDEARLKHTVELKFEIESVLRGNTMMYWVERFQAADLMASPVRSYGEVLALARSGETTVLAGVEPGRPQIGLPYRLGDVDQPSYSPAPRLGQQTRDVLLEVGFEPSYIETLIDRGVAMATE